MVEPAEGVEADQDGVAAEELDGLNEGDAEELEGLPGVDEALNRPAPAASLAAGKGDEPAAGDDPPPELGVEDPAPEAGVDDPAPEAESLEPAAVGGVAADDASLAGDEPAAGVGLDGVEDEFGGVGDDDEGVLDIRSVTLLANCNDTTRNPRAAGHRPRTRRGPPPNYSQLPRADAAR